MNELDPLTKMKVALVTNRLRQVDVAMRLGMDESEMSRILNGRRRTLPEGFEARFYQAIEDLAPSSEPVGAAA